jgi:hypothetical protein
VDAGINGATHLGGQRCGDHNDSSNYQKLAEHKSCPSAGAICHHHGGDEQIFGAE